jgi:hypothetical protein
VRVVPFPHTLFHQFWKKFSFSEPQWGFPILLFFLELIRFGVGILSPQIGDKGDTNKNTLSFCKDCALLSFGVQLGITTTTKFGFKAHKS